eukprot:TRINITY_DN4112_c0_g1_i1.p1 TRINITY_DN4112_c0_g1~~TRINITY_DN4112_c0_g1_i1.p1  ORF type:complete len:657 (+),score=259.98 TRINITY_DN4112_c0_g1_i1:2-1972(+)
MKKTQKSLRTDFLSLRSVSKCGLFVFIAIIAIALYFLHVVAEIVFLSSIPDATYNSYGIQQPFVHKEQHFINHPDFKSSTNFSNVDSVLQAFAQQKKLASESFQHMFDDQMALIEFLEKVQSDQKLKSKLDDNHENLTKIQMALANAIKLRDELKALIQKEEIEMESKHQQAAALPGNYGIRNEPKKIEHNAYVNGDDALVKENAERSQAIVKAIEHAWLGYEKFAFGKDEVKPVSQTATNWLNMGAMILDSIDLFYITGLERQYKQCKDWITNELQFNQEMMISTFETTIRSLGGLLAIHGLTGDQIFLDKAEELGIGLLKAFDDGPNPFPFATVNLKTGQRANQGWAGGAHILAEIGTMQIEFLYLAKKTGKPEYAKKALEVYKVLDEMAKDHKYYLYVRGDKSWASGSMSLGGLGDSFYEYLIKMWVFTGKKAEGYKRMWKDSMGPVVDTMYAKVKEFGFLFQTQGATQIHSLEHLTCFAGGMFVLGSQINPDFIEHAESITNSCFEMYNMSPTGLSPESAVVNLDREPYLRIGTPFYILRPEALEAIFYMWRHTHDQKYRNWGWKIFEAIEKQCRIETGGYSGLRDVRRAGSFDDSQQTFLLAETFKYLYLLFQDDSVIPLDKYVLNTEAHPLPIFEDEQWEQDYLELFPKA